MPVSRLLGTISTDCHAAPAPRSPSAAIRKQQRTNGSLACLDVGEVLRADKERDSFGDRQQQRFGRVPFAHDLKRERRAVVAGRWSNLRESLIVFEQTIERRQLLQVLPAQRASPVF